ncbi:MAG TPA: hypothetical protein PKL87_09045 [Thermotogota bacterium]|nr:MAG: hypothetical protein BWX67_02155 [Thermotogota bacterium ADurb.Bin062]HOD91814.1 hypothetical protein [Thermotogota bacterium]HOF24550.1 hypothetical protein [Thermotogota bacterium]
MTDLDPDATYTWYVKAVQSDNQTETSDVWTFKTRAGGTTGKSIKRYDSSGDFKGEYDKLSEAVAEAVNGDRIVVDGGMELKEEPEITIDGKEVTIRSSDPNNPFTIDMGGGRSAPGSKRGNNRVFHITNGASVTIRGAIIKGGDATDDTLASGGGILIRGSSTVTTINATITDNKAKTGGGVSVILSTFDTAIASNTAVIGPPVYGGGVAVLLGGTFNATETTIKSNTVIGETASGGGVTVLLYGAFNAYEGTKITENKVEGEEDAYGGGVDVWQGTFNAYEGTEITENRVEGEENAYGGGVAVTGDESGNGIFNAYGTKIADNTAEAKGDGAWAYGGGVAVGIFYAEEGIFNAYAGTTITGNTAEAEGESTASGGGVAVLPNGEFNAENVEISGNSAAVDGGGICWVCGEGGKIKTNDKEWDPPVEQNENFSVGTDGKIDSPPNPSHLVKVFDNDAVEGKQMSLWQ